MASKVEAQKCCLTEELDGVESFLKGSNMKFSDITITSGSTKLNQSINEVRSTALICSFLMLLKLFITI